RLTGRRSPTRRPRRARRLTPIRRRSTSTSCRSSRRASGRSSGHDGPEAERDRDVLDGRGLLLAERELTGRELLERLGHDEDLVRRRAVLEPGRVVHAAREGGEVVVRPEAPDHGGREVDADRDAEAGRGEVLEAGRLRELDRHAADRERRADRGGEPLARLLVVEGRAEERDDAVADHLVEDALLGPDAIDGAPAPGVDEAEDPLRRDEHLLGEPREAADVREDHGDRLLVRDEALLVAGRL